MGRVVGQTPVHRQNIHPKGRRTAETICHDWLPQKLLSRQKGRNIEMWVRRRLCVCGHFRLMRHRHACVNSLHRA